MESVIADDCHRVGHSQLRYVYAVLESVCFYFYNRFAAVSHRNCHGTCYIVFRNRPYAHGVAARVAQVEYVKHTQVYGVAPLCEKRYVRGYRQRRFCLLGVLLVKIPSEEIVSDVSRLTHGNGQIRDLVSLTHRYRVALVTAAGFVFY